MERPSGLAVQLQNNYIQSLNNMEQIMKKNNTSLTETEKYSSHIYGSCKAPCAVTGILFNCGLFIKRGLL